jgi:hypothetical protein
VGRIEDKDKRGVSWFKAIMVSGVRKGRVNKEIL